MALEYFRLDVTLHLHLDRNVMFMLKLSIFLRMIYLSCGELEPFIMVDLF